MDRSARLSLDDPVFNDRLRRQDSRARNRTRHTPRPAARIQDISNTPLKLAFQKPQKRVYRELSPPEIQSPKPFPADKTVVYHHNPIPQPKAKVWAGRPQLSLTSRPFAMYSMAVVLFVVGLAVSLAGFRANHQVQAQVNKLSSSKNNNSAGSGNSPPSTTRPSAAAISGYHVAPDLPRYIDIPALSVHARVFSAGITKTGALATPNNVFDTDWYKDSAKPGQPGAMLIDGHISSWTTRGVFYGLKDLASGDAISITRGDGQVVNYRVVRTKVYDSQNVDMASLLVSADTSKPGLNLISCSGDLIPGTNEFNKRIAVFATE